MGAEKSGIKPVSCTRLNVEGGYIYIVCFAIRNSDSTTSFIHTFIGGEIDGEELPIDYYKGSQKETTAGELFQELRKRVDSNLGIYIARDVNDMALVEKFNNQFLEKLLSDQPELYGLLGKTVVEGRIPVELERLILPLFFVTFPG